MAKALLAEPPGPGGAPRAAAAKLAREMVAEVEAAIEAVRARVARDPFEVSAEALAASRKLG